MALFPLSSNFEGDFVLQLLPVDTENTMDEVAAAAAHQQHLLEADARCRLLLLVPVFTTATAPCEARSQPSLRR